MIFSTTVFLFAFMPAFFAAYFIARKRLHRNVALLAFSLVFYAWGEPIYIFLMIFSIIMNYCFGLSIHKSLEAEDKPKAKTLLIINVTLNLLIIGFFKYADFLLSAVTLGAYSGELNLALPIGISFYTFQFISYIADIYRRKIKPQRNIIYLGAYNSAFPQLVAGPIVRYELIEDQLINRKETLEDFTAGIRRFSVGLLKKVLIADNMANLCDQVMAADPSLYGALGMWLAVFAFTLQIYYDFSGYSDMAIGLGRMMGFKYPENFNYPYIAKSVSDFWRRWHITLSGFFRDYVYIPLGGNRVKPWRWVLNITVVWMLTGLWHGAAWNFLLWGAYFGALLVLERGLLQRNLLKVPVLRNLYAIAAFTFGWIIFRADSVSHIGTILSTMFGANGAGDWFTLASMGVMRPIYYPVALFGVICAMPISRKITAAMQKKPASLALADVGAFLALIYCIIMLAAGAYSPFIYFRF
jgi:alginate O-acetyltransferase complex protein AlgI